MKQLKKQKVKLFQRLKTFNFGYFFGIALIFSISLVITISNLGTSFNFIGEDSGLQYSNPPIVCNYGISMWDNLLTFGKTGITNSMSALWFSLVCVLLKMNLTPIVIQRITYFSFFFISGIGMFFLSRYLLNKFLRFKPDNLLLFSSLFASIFYMCNRFTLWMASFPTIPFHVTYALLPVIFLVFIHILHRKHYNFPLTVIFSLLTVVILIGNPANSINVALLLLFFLVYYFSSLPSKKASLIFCASSLVIVIALSSYFLLPLLSLGSNPYGVSDPTSDALQSIYFNSSRTYLSNLFILDGWITFDDFSYAKYYNSWPLIILAQLFLVATVFVFATKQKLKVNKLLYFLLIVFLGSIFLAKGINSPFDNALVWIFSHLKIIGMYRAAYNKFIYFAVFAQSLLLSFSISHLLKKTRFSMLIMIVLFVSLTIYSAPFFMGKVANPVNLTQIPQEYENLKNRYGNSGGWITYPPTIRGAGQLLSWDANYRYVGPDFEMHLLEKPVTNIYTIMKALKIAKLDQNSLTIILNQLPLFNVSHVMIHKDSFDIYDFGAGGGKVPINAKKNNLLLDNNSEFLRHFTLVESNNYFSIYELNNDFQNSLIYSPSIIQNTTQSRLARQTVIIQDYKDSDISNIVPASVSFKKNSNSKYQLELKQERNTRSLIVFAQTFNDKWILRKEKKGNDHILSKYKEMFQLFPSDAVGVNHLKVNYIMNGFIVDQSELSLNNDEYLVLEFVPQRWFNLGLTTSITALLVLFILSLITYAKKIR